MKPTHCSIGKCTSESLPGIPVCLNHGVGIWMSMHDVVADRLRRPPGDRLLTRQQVSVMVPSLNASTFRSWVARGQISPAQETAAGAPLYWLSEIEANMHKPDGRLRPNKGNHDPVVYYLRLASGHIKIGYTTNIKQRMANLRCSDDALLATEPGGREVEARRHAQFADERIGRKEDFEASPRLLAHAWRLAQDAA